MPRYAKRWASLALILLFLTPLPATSEWPHPDTRTLPSEKSFAELVKALHGAIKDNGMLAVSKASAGAKRRGIDIACNMVIGVFRNDYVVRMLAASIEAGIEAPLRYYVTDDSDGTATLTYRTPSAVFAPYGKAELNEIAGELDAIFAAIAAQAIGG